MLVRAKTLKGYHFQSSDGTIGKVNELFFDDHHFIVRYLVADTGPWLDGKQVLISPYSILEVNKVENFISINLPKSQIERSASLEKTHSALEQFELAYYGNNTKNWNGPYAWGAFSYIPREQNSWEKANLKQETWPPNLHSTTDLLGHHIQANNGSFGHIEGVILDDEVWAIRYLIINTQNWWLSKWLGKKVLVSPKWIDPLSWQGKEIVINYPFEHIKKSPEFTELSTLDRSFEHRLHEHYKQQGYWHS